MKFELNNLPRNCSNEDVLAEIRRVDALVGKDKLTQSDYEKYSKMGIDGVKLRFGSWEKALIAAGLGHKYFGTKITDKMRNSRARYLTNDDILKELQRIAKLLNKETVSIEDVKSHSNIIHPGIVNSRFGSWVAGMEKAGLKVSEKYNRAYSDEEYFENLLNVWIQHGRQPFSKEMDSEPSKISSGGYKKHFGSWHKALQAFVVRMNQDESKVGKSHEKEQKSDEVDSKPIVIPKIKSSIFVEDRREIGLGLRYKILSRDKFKCVRCGTSPSTDHSCRLHVDHIVPFSKGGKTTLENLQTLCEKCNLGKGNRHSE